RSSPRRPTKTTSDRCLRMRSSSAREAQKHRGASTAPRAQVLLLRRLTSLKAFLCGSVALWLILTCAEIAVGAQAPPPARNNTLTAVGGIKVGHFTLPQRPTGCTVVLVEAGATAGVDVRGAAPATRETDLLKPEKMVQQVYGIALSGGSLFGLDA